jgi:hypothetical protein
MRAATFVIIASTLASAGAVSPSPASAPDGSRTFQGSWSAVGRRHTLPTDRGTASVVQLSGAVVLTDGTGARFGFQGQAIGFDDADGLNVGRAVWTDAHGNRVFSVLKGEPLQTGRRIVGTIAGGSGAYAGVTGEYELTWQYVVSGEDGVVQGRTVDLTGRLRPTGKQP